MKIYRTFKRIKQQFLIDQVMDYVTLFYGANASAFYQATAYSPITEVRKFFIDSDGCRSEEFKHEENSSVPLRFSTA